MIVPLSDSIKAPRLIREVITAFPDGRLVTKSMAAWIFGSILPGANCPSLMYSWSWLTVTRSNFS